MKEQRYDTLEGLSAPILVYENVEEAEKVQAGGVLTQANNNMAYRGVLPVVREIICNLVEDASGVEREKKEIGKTKGGKPIVQWEADGRYVKRAMAAKGWDDLTRFQTELDTQCRDFKEDGEEKGSALAVDVKGAERKAPGPRRLSVEFKTAAAKVITLGATAAVNSNQLAKIGKTFTATNDTTKMFTGSFPGADGKEVQFNVSDKDAETLGYLIKDFMAWKMKQELISL